MRDKQEEGTLQPAMLEPAACSEKVSDGRAWLDGHVVHDGFRHEGWRELQLWKKAEGEH